MSFTTRVRRGVLGAGLLALAGAVTAADYPERPIRWVLGFPPGGTSDFLARLLSERLTASLGQQVIIDNRPGASGIIANELGVRANPDGHTILLVSSTFANLVAMGRKLSYDPFNDLAPIAQLASVPNIVTVHPSVPIKSVNDLIAAAKAKPKSINYGTGGVATGPHLATELFQQMTGTELVHIPYKGTPPAVNDLVAGRVSVMFGLSPVVMPHIKANRLRPVAVSGKVRLDELPGTPTVADTVPGYEATVWYGVLAPAKTPKRIIARLNADMLAALKNEEVRKRMASVGFIPEGTTPEGFTAYIRNEADKWRKVIERANIRF